ncbi:ErmCL family antibiotic resistance leader peptide [Mammaliicoccus sciuri]
MGNCSLFVINTVHYNHIGVGYNEQKRYKI